MLKEGNKLKPYIIASNLIYLIFPIASYYLLPSYSPENSLIIDQSSPLAYSVSFDGSHFLTNYYTHQKNYAFLPGFVMIVRLLNYFFPINITVLIILIINKICTALSSIILMNIVQLLTKNNQLSVLSAIVFLFNPAVIFYHAVYSEAIYSLILFSGIFKAIQPQIIQKDEYQRDISNPFSFITKNIWSLLLFGVSCGFRMTGVFISLIYGIPILTQLYQAVLKFDFVRSVKITLTGIFTLSFFLIQIILYLYVGAKQFCTNDISNPPFCSDTFPNVYSYIQTQFWHCGFLSYYVPQRAFFIILGLPSILICLLTLVPTQLQGLNISYYVLVIITIAYSNIQSSSRFFSSHPLYLLGLAKNLTISSKMSVKQKIIIGYLIFYNVLGIILFPHRFPWT